MLPQKIQSGQLAERARLLSERWQIMTEKARALTSKDLVQPDFKDPTVLDIRQKMPSQFDETFNLLCEKTTGEILKLCMFWGYTAERMPSSQKLNLFVAKLVMQNESWLRLSYLVYITYSLIDGRIKLGGVVHRLPERNKFQFDPDWLSDCFDEFGKLVFNLKKKAETTYVAPANIQPKTITTQNYADSYAAGVLAVLQSAKKYESESEYPVFYNAMIRAEKLWELVESGRADSEVLAPILTADPDALLVYRQIELATKNMDKILDKNYDKIHDVFLCELKTDFFADFFTLCCHIFGPISEIVCISDIYALYNYAKNCNYWEIDSGETEIR